MCNQDQKSNRGDPENGQQEEYGGRYNPTEADEVTR